MKTNTCRQKLLSVVLAVLLVVCGLWECITTTASPVSIEQADAQLRTAWNQMYKENKKEFATIKSSSITEGAQSGLSGNVNLNKTASLPPQADKYLGENYLAVDKHLLRAMWPWFTKLSDNSTIYDMNNYFKEYTNIFFYVYTGTVGFEPGTDNDNLCLRLTFTDNSTVDIVKNLTTADSNKYIKFDILNDLNLNSITELLNSKGEGITLKTTQLWGERNISFKGLFVGGLIGVDRVDVAVPEDCTDTKSLLVAAKKFDATGYVNADAFLQAREQLQELYDSIAISEGIEDLKTAWSSMVKTEKTEIATLKGNNFTKLEDYQWDSSVGRLLLDTSDTPTLVNISSLGENIIKVNKQAARGIWPYFYNLSGNTIVDAEKILKDYDDIILPFYTGTVQKNGGLQLIYEFLKDNGVTKKVVLSKELTTADSDKIVTFSLLNDSEFDSVSDFLDSGSEGGTLKIKLESDNENGGQLQAYHLVIGALMGCNFIRAQIPAHLTNVSTIKDWLTAAQDFDTDGFSGAVEFNKAINNLSNILEPSGKYCGKEIEELKAAWEALETNGEPKAVQWRGITGTLGGAIKAGQMPEFSPEDKEKLGDYAAAYDIDDVGTGTGNAWIVNCPVVPGAKSLENYSDLYQWIYSGEVTSVNQKVKILWDFKDGSGGSKLAFEKEILMEPNTWYCIKLTDCYESMESFIEIFGTNTVSSIIYNLYNKPFTVNGMVLGTIFALEKQNLIIPEALTEDCTAPEWLYMAEQVDTNSCKDTVEFYNALNNLRNAINNDYKLVEGSLIKRLNTLWSSNTDVKNTKRIGGITELEVKDGYTMANTSLRNNIDDFNGLPLGTDKSVLGRYYARATFPSLRYFIFRDTENNGNRFSVSLKGYNCLYFYVYAENVTSDGLLDMVALNMNWKFLGEPKIAITREKSDQWIRVCITSDTLEKMFTGEEEDILASVQVYNTDGNIQADAIYISDLFIGNIENLAKPGKLKMSSPAEDWANAAENIPEYNTTSKFKLATKALKTFFTDKGKSLTSIKYLWEELDLKAVPKGIAPDNAGALIRAAKAFDISQYEGNPKGKAFVLAIAKAEEYYSVNISVDINGNGSVDGKGIHYIGEVVTLNAIITEGNDFAGWFENDKIIKYANAEYKFIASSDRNLELLSLKGLGFNDENSGIFVKINRLTSTDGYEDVVGFVAEKHTLTADEQGFTDEYGFEVLSAYKIKFIDKNGKIVNGIGGRTITITYPVPASVKAGITNLVNLSDDITLCNANYYENKLVYTCEYENPIFTLLKLK